MNSRIINIIFICFLALTMSSSIRAEETNEPIKITSDRLISDNKSKIITFIGNVKAVRNDLIMRANSIEILQKNDESRGNGIDMIIARGNVRINKGSKFATAEKAIYYEVEQKIILTGNPHYWEDKNEMSGEEMTFFMKEDRLVVKQGKKEQVNVVFYPDKEKKSK